MPTFHVYHAEQLNSSFFVDSDAGRESKANLRRFPEGFTKVATVQADHIEDAYRATNNINRPWTQNPEVTVVDEAVRARGGARSTSVGDIISIEDHAPMVVDFVGFVPLRAV